MVLASRWSSGMSASARQVLNRNSWWATSCRVPPVLASGEELAELFLGDPGAQDLPGRVVVHQLVPHLGEGLVGADRPVVEARRRSQRPGDRGWREQPAAGSHDRKTQALHGAGRRLGRRRRKPRNASAVEGRYSRQFRPSAQNSNSSRRSYP